MMKILIIEDEEDIFDLYRGPLEQAGYKVFWCSSGKTVDDAIAQENPDLLMVDIKVPDFDVSQFAQTYANRFPMVVVSGNLDDEIRNQLIKDGVRHFVHKPVRIKDTVEMVNQIFK